MLVDHLGAMSFLGEWSRFVGRFALPAFVVMIAYHAAISARPDLLARRVLLLLLLSQPFWWLSVGFPYRLCILATLLAVVLLVSAWRSRRYVLLSLVLLLFLCASPWIEYGPFPLLLVPLVLVPWGILPALVWPLVQYSPGPLLVAAALSLVLLVLLLRVPFNVPRAPRWFTRWFYPVHLAILSTLV